MADPAEVSVLIPTLDEAKTVGDVIDGFVEEGFERVIVVDGHSSDDTVDVARQHGAAVVVQSGTGKGHAVREGLEHVETPFAILVDGDGTYRPADAADLMAPLWEREAEYVIGNRFADLHPGAMTRLNRIGNRLINRVFTRIHGRNLADILSGYRAFTVGATERMRLTAGGFGIETEMAVECVRQDIRTEVVDITYRPRPDRSTSNLRPVRDGGVIFSTLYRLARTTNPLFYYGSLAVLSVLASLLTAGFVVYEWFVRGVPHQVLAMVAAFGILFGLQLFTFGVLTDMIVRLYR